jgi:protein-serine/threonine kinase
MDDDGEVIYSTPLPGASSTPAHNLQPPPPPPPEKPADYVYYERRPDDLSSDARARATAAKVKLQSHYRLALETAIDLNVRCVYLFMRVLAHRANIAALEERSSRDHSRAYRKIDGYGKSGDIRGHSLSF